MSFGEMTWRHLSFQTRILDLGLYMVSGCGHTMGQSRHSGAVSSRVEGRSCKATAAEIIRSSRGRLMEHVSQVDGDEFTACK